MSSRQAVEMACPTGEVVQARRSACQDGFIACHQGDFLGTGYLARRWGVKTGLSRATGQVYPTTSQLNVSQWTCRSWCLTTCRGRVLSNRSCFLAHHWHVFVRHSLS